MRCMAFDVSCVLFCMTTCFGEDAGKPPAQPRAPQAEIQTLPMPAPAPSNLLMQNVVPMYEHGTREYWTNYGVDETGHYRPRVILSPYGAYYFYDMSPFPWTTTHSNSMLKYELD